VTYDALNVLSFGMFLVDFLTLVLTIIIFVTDKKRSNRLLSPKNSELLPMFIYQCTIKFLYEHCYQLHTLPELQKSLSLPQAF
jgi:hypothetical protein